MPKLMTRFTKKKNPKYPHRGWTASIESTGRGAGKRAVLKLTRAGAGFGKKKPGDVLTTIFAKDSKGNSYYVPRAVVSKADQSGVVATTEQFGER